MRGIVDVITDTMEALPKAGAIEGRDYLVLKSLMDLLSDPKRLLDDPVLSVPDEAAVDSAPTPDTPEVSVEPPIAALVSRGAWGW